MGLILSRVNYNLLNSRQQENYNFQKISAVLADYGFITYRLSDDWQGADFIAQHIDGDTFLKVQLKGRLSFEKKYKNKGIYIVFQNKGNWYLYLHDELLDIVLKETTIENTKSWTIRGGYSFPYLSVKLSKLLEPYRIFPFETQNLG
jgi:hypothetical protein